jgi:Hg(II)-responsive transcriptional regulator
MPSLLTIGRIAKLTEVNIETVRYYERHGLLPAPPRTVSSYRLYGDQSVARLRFIKQAQALGFTLEEIGELLALRVDAETSCDVVRQRAERKMADVAEKIRSLQAIQGALAELIAACALGGPEGECPFLASLEKQPIVKETEQ